MKEKPIRLSPTSGLNLYKECPRCFWLHYNKKIHRPRGPFPSLPGGMDLVIKNYFDMHRDTLPPELKGKVEGELMSDVGLMNKWRNWRTGLEYEDKKLNATLFGALDECIVNNNLYVPVDYKTRGSAPKDGDSEKYYQTQLDAYALLLDSNGYKAADFAYLIYYFPEWVQTEGVVKFNVQPVKLETSTTRAKRIFEDAVKALKAPLPKKHSACEYCNWGDHMLELEFD